MSARLYELKLKLISACDYRCQMCGHWREPVTRLTTDEAKVAIRDAAGLGALSLILSGGEPTLHKGLLEIVAEAARLGLRVTLATNGGGLAEGMLERLLAAGVAQLNVSVDSPVPEVHDRLRGIPGSFARIEEGARRAAALGHPIALKTVVTRDTVDSLGEAASLAFRMAASGLSFTLVTANEPGMEPLLLRAPELHRWFFSLLPRILSDGAARNIGVKLFPIFRRFVGAKPLALAESLRALATASLPADVAAELSAFERGAYGFAFAGREPCPVLRGKALVRPDGGIYSCCEISHTEDLRMGSVKPRVGDPRLADPEPRGLACAWTAPGYAALRESPPTPVHEKCWGCTEWFSRPPEALTKRPRLPVVERAEA